MPPTPEELERLRRVGERLRAARSAKNISLRQFAEKIDLTSSYYSKVERGEALAAVETYEAICRELGFDDPQTKGLITELGLMDSETRKAIEQEYRYNPSAVSDYFRKRAEKRGQ